MEEAAVLDPEIWPPRFNPAGEIHLPTKSIRKPTEMEVIAIAAY